ARLYDIETLTRNVARRVGELTPTLLAKAFRGELVEQDPDDEPAAVLLERIRASRADIRRGSRRGIVRNRGFEVLDDATAPGQTSGEAAGGRCRGPLSGFASGPRSTPRDGGRNRPAGTSGSYGWVFGPGSWW